MVFKGSLYLLNLICGMIPCEHKYPLPDTTPSNVTLGEELNYDTNATWNSGDSENLIRDAVYEEGHPLVVRTKSGLVRGYWMRVVGGQRIRAFEGIPYALPPINERRFRAPTPIKPWNGILGANLKGPKCLQYNDIALPNVIGSENCLYLNIYSKWPSRKNDSVKYPTIIYISGSGFLTGSGNDFGPAYLLQDDLILVTINYRLGVFGFLSTSDDECPGNAGLKDQSEAINWIYDNIESFNGNRDKIVLLGHGAGGASVNFLSMSFKARGKFIAGISISGTSFNQWALHTKDQAVNLTKSFAKAMHCPIHGSTKTIVDCLRKQRGFDLAKMQTSFLDKWPSTLSLFRPVVEDEYQKEDPFMTDTPEEAYRKGTVDKIPWICGVAEDEGYTFLLPHVGLGSFGNLRRNWNSLAPDFFNYNDLPVDQDEITRRVNWLYFKHSTPSSAPIKIYSDALGSRLIYSGVHKALQAHSQHAETYAFMFGYNGKYNLAASAGIRPSEWAVGHGEILGYILNSTNTYAGFQKNDTELVLSNILVNLIYNFADKQVPGFTTEMGEKFHVWNPVADPRNISFLYISKTIKMIPEPYLQQVLYWESLGLPDTLPLANYSNEIQNVPKAPNVKGFVSTDITVTGNEVPRDLLPPSDLNPGTFENGLTTSPPPVSTTTAKHPGLTTTTSLELNGNSVIENGNDNMKQTRRPSTASISITTSEPIKLDTTTPVSNALSLTTTSSSSTTTTTKKPKFDRWIAQDWQGFIPMPDQELNFDFSLTDAPKKRTTTAEPMPTTRTFENENFFPNMIDFPNQNEFPSKDVTFGIAVPILPTQPNTRFVTKSQINADHYLNSLGSGSVI